MSLLNSSRPIARAARMAPSAGPSRAASYARPPSPWPTKAHLKPSPTLPNPVPALYAQKVVLSDGSTFTSYSTAPTPQILRLTRDVTNNPLWAPGTEKRGLGDGIEEGRVGRFMRRFDSADATAATSEGSAPAKKNAFAQDDLSWMSVGAEEEKISDKQRGGPVKTKDSKKRK